MAQKFKVEGRSELEDALKALPLATALGVLRRTLIKRGQVIADAGQALAPRLTGGLQQSYTVGTKLSRRQKSRHRKGSDVEVFVGPTPHAKSVQTEFGNAHQAPQPHLRPAWDGNVDKVLDGIAADLREEIDKTVQRAARRAQRRAAKMLA